MWSMLLIYSVCIESLSVQHDCYLLHLQSIKLKLVKNLWLNQHFSLESSSYRHLTFLFLVFPLNLGGNVQLSYAHASWYRPKMIIYQWLESQFKNTALNSSSSLPVKIFHFLLSPWNTKGKGCSWNLGLLYKPTL